MWGSSGWVKEICWERGVLRKKGGWTLPLEARWGGRNR